MTYKNLIVEKKDYVGTITINRPPVNSINLATVEEFGKALDDLGADKEVRAVIITGAGGKSFSAGFDINDAANAEKIGKCGSDTWSRIDRFQKPIIAAINGFAFGGGCELALACHFRIMADTPKVKIGLTELNLGIIPGWGGTQRMTRVVGKAKALDMILFSKRIPGKEALEIGLVNKVVAVEDLMEEATALAKTLSERPPLAVSAVLKAISTGLDYGMNEGLKIEQEGVDITRNSKDAIEGFTAFFEKRKPAFKGE